MNTNIAQEIVILRANHSWTQQQLAEKLGTTQRTVAAWETGDSVPRKTMRVKMAQVFELPDNYFLDISEQYEIIRNPDEANLTDSVEKMIEKIDDVLSESDLFSREEDKGKVLKVFHKALQEFTDDL